MATDIFEVLEETSLHYLVSERLATRQEISRVRELGGKLVHLSPTQLVEIYDSWQAHHREYANEPLVATMVRSTVTLNTESDVVLDVTGMSLELEHNPAGLTDEELHELANEATEQIFDDPSKSADSLSGQQLAKLVASVTLEHGKHDLELHSEREFFLQGDIEDPVFRAEVYRRFVASTETVEEIQMPCLIQSMEEERESDEEIDLERNFIESLGGREQYAAKIKDHYARMHYDDRFPELAETSTTVQAGNQLAAEAASYGFDFIPNL